MPLIESEPTGKKSTFEVELDGETRKRLKQYCRFSRNTGLKGRNRVIREALRLIFKQDAEFQEWIKTDAAAEDDAEGGGARKSKKDAKAAPTPADAVA